MQSWAGQETKMESPTTSGSAVWVGQDHRSDTLMGEVQRRHSKLEGHGEEFRSGVCLGNQLEQEGSDKSQWSRDWEVSVTECNHHQ